MTNNAWQDETSRRSEESPKKWGSRPRWLNYGIALISSVLATLCSLLLDPFVPAHPHCLWFLLALLFTAWYAGPRAALLNLLLGLLFLTFFVVHPRGTFQFESLDDQVGVALYGLTAVCLVLYVRLGAMVREVIQSGLEQTPFQAIPEKITEVETKLAKHIIEAELAEKRLAVQYQVSQILIHSDSIHDAARPILHALCETMRWEVGLFWLLDTDASVLSCIEAFGLTSAEVGDFERYSKQLRFSKGEGFPGRVWDADRVVWIADFAREPDLARWSLADKRGLHEAIGVPVRNGVTVLGVMEFLGPKVGEPNERLLQMVACIASQISQFIERTAAERTLRVQDQERRIAKQIQDALLPTLMPEVAGFSIAGKCVPVAAVGGDGFDFIPMPVGCQQCLGIVIGDASGHGVGAALLITETCAYLRGLALTQGDVGSMLTLTNTRLSGTPTDHFVTLLLARLDPRNKTLTYAGAGHCPGYVLDGRGNTKAILTSTGPPLGVDKLTQFPTSADVALVPNDLVVLFTDGILEPRSAEWQQFGLTGILGTVRANRHRRPKEIIEVLFRAVKDHAQNHILDDDATAVIVKVEGEAVTQC